MLFELGIIDDWTHYNHSKARHGRSRVKICKGVVQFMARIFPLTGDPHDRLVLYSDHENVSDH